MGGRVRQGDLGRRIATGDVVVVIDADSEITAWLAPDACILSHAGSAAPAAQLDAERALAFV